MAWKRVVLEMGMGADIHGGDYTKAAVRAVRDALWHSSLSVTRALDKDWESARVEVTIGVPQPDRVDRDAVAAALPHGAAAITVIAGGLEIPDEDGSDRTIMANAAAVVSLDLP